jgi:hypothetical protein
VTDERTASQCRHDAGVLRGRAADLRITAAAEAKAVEEQAAGLVARAEELERSGRPEPGDRGEAP